MSSYGPDVEHLLRLYTHFQTDIENVKRRQWRDFNAILAGQGSLLLLSRDFKEENILFAILSFLLWLAGTYFLIENREVLEVYRTGKGACLKKLKEDDGISNILEPPDTPTIPGKYHHRILTIATLATTALVIWLLLKPKFPVLPILNEIWMVIACSQMFAILQFLEYLVPRIAKTDTRKSWFYRNFIE